MAPGGETSLAQIRFMGGGNTRTADLGRPWRHKTRQSLRSDRGLYDHLSDVNGPLRLAHAGACAGQEHWQFIGESAIVLGSTCHYDLSSKQSHCPDGSLALHPLLRWG